MSDAAEQAVLKVLDRGPMDLMTLWIEPSLRDFTVEDVGRALGALLKRGALTVDPKFLSYRIKSERIDPDDLHRALDETY